ncbi:hypothetical protein [Bacillus bombysepticus]|uniref:hypothetical protein n=1 Tax=Bacillus bombysepticus TaxID=658666 RepID=UPI003015BC14
MFWIVFAITVCVLLWSSYESIKDKNLLLPIITASYCVAVGFGYALNLTWQLLAIWVACVIISSGSMFLFKSKR